jgi:hypothetical protein
MKMLMSTASPQLLSINPNVLFSNGFLNYSRKKGACKVWKGEKVGFALIIRNGIPYLDCKK